jgi:hypothetical protein
MKRSARSMWGAVKKPAVFLVRGQLYVGILTL